MIKLRISPPSEKQKLFLKADTKHIGFGGARGGGKSWSVRTKAKLLALAFAGIRILIVRRTYPELINNHINILRKELLGIATYNDKDKVLKFSNALSPYQICATITRYCAISPLANPYSSRRTVAVDMPSLIWMNLKRHRQRLS